MAGSVTVHRTKEDFQAQYHTLWNAAEAYLDGKMLTEQARGFENVVPPEFLAAVAQTRLLRLLVAWVKQA